MYEHDLLRSLSFKTPKEGVTELPPRPGYEEGTGTPLRSEGTFAQMTDEEKAAAGYVQIGKNRWRYAPNGLNWKERVTPYVSTNATFENGRFKWVTHGHSDLGDLGYIPDLQCEEGARVCEEMGHAYLPDKGPATFKSKRDLDRYLRETNHFERGGGKDQDTEMDKMRKKYPRLRNWKPDPSQVEAKYSLEHFDIQE